MNVKYMYSLLAVIALFLLAYLGVEVAGLQLLFGIVIPYAAVAIFLAGVVYRVTGWARSAVPFRIPSTCGQQQSLPWIKPDKFDNPFTPGAVAVRMALEVGCFRSLFRNTRNFIQEGKIVYQWEIWLWVAALAFHYAFLTVLIRHMRLFTQPVPAFVKLVENIDSFFRFEILTDTLKVGVPGVYLSGLVLLAAVTFLFFRRIVLPQIKYISLPADFFPLFLIFGIALTGILMRYFAKVDILSIKEMTMGLVSFHPSVPQGISPLFYVHLFFVCALLAYFPFSKLMHMGGVFLSPTRNLPGNSRAVRHVNPWNYPVEVHTYEEYEEEFREKMIDAGLPVEKE